LTVNIIVQYETLHNNIDSLGAALRSIVALATWVCAYL